MRKADKRIMPLCPDKSGRRFKHYGTPNRISMSFSVDEIKIMRGVVAANVGAGPSVRADHPHLRRLLPKLTGMLKRGRAAQERSRKAQENSDADAG